MSRTSNVPLTAHEQRACLQAKFTFNRVPKCDVTKIKILQIMGFTEIF